MIFSSLRLIAFFVVVHTSNVFCQDKVYLGTSSRQGKVIDINSSTIAFNPASGGKAENIALGNAVLVFNSKGDFLVPSKLNFSQALTKQLVDRYLHPDNTPFENDYVYTLHQPRIAGTVMGIEKKVVVVGDGTAVLKIDKSNVVAIIYRDGRHEIFGPVKNASDVLWAWQSTIAPVLVKDSSKTGSALVKTAEPEPAAATGNVPAPVVVKPGIPVEASATQTGVSASSTSLTFDDVAGNAVREEFEKKALQKTKQLNTYLKIICDKSASTEDVNKAVEMSVTLFVDDNAVVEISSINNNETVHKKIRQYLSHIKYVQYDKIEIEWTNVQYVSDLKKGPDGNFYGVVSFEQVFRGYRDGKIVYQDITRKNVTVILKTYEKNVQGATKDDWEVLLGDIGVISTKSV
ncbi:MAG: hypothetical protein H7Y03_07990 [Chitinophagaceae bacterium]|nr:hypothetical protein [Chitinophagaceae bacterium]